MKTRKIFLFAVTIIMMMFAFPLGVSAENALPVLRYKIVNHDKVSLKWKGDKSAEYYLCKYDIKNDKIVKETKVSSNVVTLKNLSPDTEYAYLVKYVIEDNETYSNVINFTTPAEWYIEQFPSEDYWNWYYGNTKLSKEFAYNLYIRKHYDGSGREEFYIENTPASNFNVKLYVGDRVYFLNNSNGLVDYAADKLPDEDDFRSLYVTKNDGTGTKEIKQIQLCADDGLPIFRSGDNIIFAKNFTPLYVREEYVQKRPVCLFARGRETDSGHRGLQYPDKRCAAFQ